MKFNTYNGAVFFIDILGFGALTKGELKLSKCDFDSWSIKWPNKRNSQYFAAVLLSVFRDTLNKTHLQYPKINICQLSDCAFVWSENASDILSFIFSFMNSAVFNGLLCRGGVSSGQIIEPSKNNSNIGQFIVGEAVTKAVNLESLAKGMRVIMDVEFPQCIWNDKEFTNKKKSILPYIFQPIYDPILNKEIDEIQWYLIDQETFTNIDYNFNLSTEERKELTKKRLLISTFLNQSPLFHWNASNKDGLNQLSASVNFISRSGLLNIEHPFSFERAYNNKRSFSNVKRMSNIIMQSEEYSVREKLD